MDEMEAVSETDRRLGMGFPDAAGLSEAARLALRTIGASRG